LCQTEIPGLIGQQADHSNWRQFWRNQQRIAGNRFIREPPSMRLQLSQL